MSSPPTRPRSPLLPAVAVGCGAAALVLLVLVAAGWAPLLAFDRAVADELHTAAVRRSALTEAMRVLTDWVWDPVTLRLLLAAAAVALWRSGRPGMAGLLVAAGLVAAGVQHLVKALVGRDRPRWPDPVDTADFAAFPSGHAMTAAVVCGLLWWVAVRLGPRALARPVLVAGAVSTAGVGLTRVYLGVHWPSDVLGGWLLGACLVAVAVGAYERRAAVAPRRSAALLGPKAR
ncbi:phosphatase PAP2 family protein [Streptomyces fradiae]|uniref:phosphatase PAP2 family protein n=1 Tax=Streptomyces fradiae TaxID=1906 RepID=UPI00365501D7